MKLHTVNRKSQGTSNGISPETNDKKTNEKDWKDNNETWKGKCKKTKKHIKV